MNNIFLYLSPLLPGGLPSRHHGLEQAHRGERGQGEQSQCAMTIIIIILRGDADTKIMAILINEANVSLQGSSLCPLGQSVMGGAFSRDSDEAVEVCIVSISILSVEL